jgi:hypothetical protein
MQHPRTRPKCEAHDQGTCGSRTKPRILVRVNEYAARRFREAGYSAVVVEEEPHRGSAARSNRERAVGGDVLPEEAGKRIVHCVSLEAFPRIATRAVRSLRTRKQIPRLDSTDVITVTRVIFRNTGTEIIALFPDLWEDSRGIYVQSYRQFSLPLPAHFQNMMGHTIAAKYHAYASLKRELERKGYLLAVVKQR